MRNSRKVLLVYLGLLAAAGAGVVYLATSKMGPGVSTDSAMILSTAENLIKGRGLVDYTGKELTQFPPLYSMLLGAGSLVSRQDVFVVGWFLNVLVFAALICFTGLYLYDAFPDEPILAYFGSFIVLTSTSLIVISSNIASDPLFMLILIFFLMSASAYLRTGDIRYGVLAAVLTVISCFQRYAGLSLVISGSLIAAYSHRRHLQQALAAGLLFAVITGAPIFAWGYLHNAPLAGTVFGARLPSVASDNFITGAQKVLYWFIPYRIIAAVGTLPLLLVITAACSVLVVAGGARRFWQEINRPEIIPNIVFLVVYLSVLVFDISYYELKGLKTDRVHIIGLTSLLIVLSTFARPLIRAARQRLGNLAVYVVASVLFLGWSAYPITKTDQYVRESMAHGDVSSYNSINKDSIQESPLAHYLHGLDLNGKRVYTNGVDTAWFILRRQVYSSPTFDTDNRSTELKERFNGWPGASVSGYIVWLNAEAHKTNYATPAELSSIADVSQLYADDSASVYAVKAR